MLTLLMMAPGAAVQAAVEQARYGAETETGHAQVSLAAAQAGAKLAQGDARSPLPEAQALRDRGDWLTAVQRYEAIIKSSDSSTAAQASHELAKLFGDLTREEEAVPLLESALAHYQSIEQPLKEAEALIALGAAYDYLSLSFQSLEHIQQGLDLLTQLGKEPVGQTRAYREVLSKGVFEAGKIHLLLGRQEAGIALLKESVKLAQELDNPLREAAAYNLLAYGYLFNRQPDEAQEVLAKGRSQLQSVLDSKTLNPPEEVRAISRLGSNHFFAGNYDEALQRFEQAAQGYEALGLEHLMGEQLNQVGNVYSVMPRYQQSITAFEKALAVFERLGDRRRMAENLSSMSSSYTLVGEPGKMLQAKVDALAALRALRQSMPENLAPPLNDEAEMLAGMGEAQVNLGDYEAAVVSLKAAIKLYEQLNRQVDSNGQPQVLPESELALADSWRKLGDVYQRQSQTPEAIAALETAMTLAEAGNHGMVIAQSQVNLGSIYAGLGDMDRAMALMEEARSFDPSSMVPAVAEVPVDFDQTSTTLLQLAQQAQSPQIESIALLQIASEAEEAGDLDKALDISYHILERFQAQGNLTEEAWQWSRIAMLQGKLSQPAAARRSYEQLAILAQELGDRNLERNAYFFIGNNLERQGQPELAIVFYKQFVSVTESVRGDLASLDRQQREGFQKTFAPSYRNLADLLLQRDRVIEAQEVLDLLKIQEVEDFFQNDYQVAQRGENDVTLTILRPEQEILAQYGNLQKSAVDLGLELTELRQIAEGERSPQQTQRITNIIALQEQLNQQFNGFLQNDSVLVHLDQLSRKTRRQSIDPTALDELRLDLGKLDAAMLYPLVLEERLELIITTPDSPPLRRTVPVGSAELNRTIVEFRQALQNPSSDAKKPAQQLYQWLVEPLESDLSQAEIDKIIYAPDGPLRYVPLGALHDGQGWLIERFAVNNITSKSLTSLTKQPLRKPKLLAGAFADPGLNYAMAVGDRRLGFGGLPFAGIEVAALMELMPGSKQLLDEQFTVDAVKPQLENHGIIHFATHAAFVPGDPSDSFIVFGDGDRATLRDINSWSLNNVDLVVLSACETGLGGQLGNGEEILGLGYQFQQRGAKAAVASLWQVDDGGTQALMTAFYEGLQGGEMTKLEALQAAQLRLIGSKGRGAGQSRFAFKPPELPEESVVEAAALSHPYYWAPFILIGNGL